MLFRRAGHGSELFRGLGWAWAGLGYAWTLHKSGYIDDSILLYKPGYADASVPLHKDRQKNLFLPP